MWFDNMIHVTRTIAQDSGVMMVGVNGCHLDESLGYLSGRLYHPG